MYFFIAIIQLAIDQFRSFVQRKNYAQNRLKKSWKVFKHAIQYVHKLKWLQNIFLSNIFKFLNVLKSKCFAKAFDFFAANYFRY